MKKSRLAAVIVAIALSILSVPAAADGSGAEDVSSTAFNIWHI
ncbi:MAG: hypothetical protein ACK5RL_08875 [Acidimicrobiales bacterium]